MRSWIVSVQPNHKNCIRTINYEIYNFLDHNKFYIDIGKHPNALVFTLLTLSVITVFLVYNYYEKIIFHLYQKFFFFFFLITLSLNLPRSLWFDLGTSRILWLQSPALGWEWASAIWLRKVWILIVKNHNLIILEICG